MGCCVSTERNEPSRLEKQQPFQGGSESLKPTKSPPPSLYHEETVKEVLSETPKPKPPKSPIENPRQENGLQHQEVHKESIHLDPAFLDEVKIKENKFKNISKEEAHHQGQVFEQDESEVCSLSYSESISTTTTNNNDKRDYYYDDDEVKQRVSRSPLPPRNRSPTRRTTEQSPSKRNGAINGGSVRLVQSRETGSGQVGARRGSRTSPKKRDPGEGSARRSRSPATNRSAMGRSSSTRRRTNQSPGRVRKDAYEGGVASSSNVANGTTNDESLENPLVSLECFIFL
ncbi:serine/arginine repetitive matrix protein [Salix suchowensis]|nr:serine/arginine repetitive matrix protein [Salix suchowensis]